MYDEYFRVAQATPRGVVAKLCAIVGQLGEACEKHASLVKVGVLSSVQTSLKLGLRARRKKIIKTALV